MIHLRHEYRMTGAERCDAALQSHPRRRARSLRYPKRSPASGASGLPWAIGAAKNEAASCEFVHVAVDDASRPAFVEVLPDEKRHSPASWSGRCAGTRDSAFGSRA
jgi:hypothetical protein